MKRFLLALLLVVANASLAFAQGAPPCFTTNGTNCIPVGTSNPLPVGNASPTVVYISPSTVPYTYTPTSNKQLIFAHVVVIASSTVSNRYFKMSLVNTSGDVVGDWHSSALITASQTRHIEFMPGTYRETAFDANGSIQVPFPQNLIVPANYSLIFSDATGVVTNDTLAVGLEIK